MEFLESYKIDSPEHVEVELSLAGLGSRTIAYVLDTLFRVLAGLFVLLIIALSGLGRLLQNLSEIVTVLLVIFFFLLQWAYFVLFEMLMNGQTPGKRIMKIRVVKDEGYPLTFFSSAIRNLIRVVDFLPALYGVGIFLIFISDKKKRLGDYLAGTIVIHQQQTKWTLPVFAQKEQLKSAKRFPLVRLTEEEKQVIREYLERMDSLDAEDRLRVGEKIYQKMAQRSQSR